MCTALPPHVTCLLTQSHQNLFHQAVSISLSAVSVKHTLKRTKRSIHLNITFPALIFMIEAIRPGPRISWARAVSSMLKMRCFSELLSFCYRNMSRLHKQWHIFVKFFSELWNIPEGFQILKLETIITMNVCFVLIHWALFKHMLMMFCLFH